MSSLLPPGFCPGPCLQFLSRIGFIQQSPCSPILRRVSLSHALAFSASQFVRKKKSPRIYTSMHSGGIELTKLTYTRLVDNLIRHRGDRILPRTKYRMSPLPILTVPGMIPVCCTRHHHPQQRLTHLKQNTALVVCETELPHTNATAAAPQPSKPPQANHSSTTAAPQQQRQQQRRR